MLPRQLKENSDCNEDVRHPYSEEHWQQYVPEMGVSGISYTLETLLSNVTLIVNSACDTTVHWTHPIYALYP